jgi:hypothetical protein
MDDASATEDVADGGLSMDGAPVGSAEYEAATVPGVTEPDQTLQPTPGGRPFLCHNGGGSSACNISSGEYEIQSIDNTCCTEECTAQHEQQHVKDFTAWGCCKKAADAWRTTANRGKVVEMYNAWLDKARPLSECNAYRNDVKCATALQHTKDCNGKGKDTDCCLDILDYKNRYSTLAADYCARAPSKVPPCPNFDLATLLLP